MIMSSSFKRRSTTECQYEKSMTKVITLVSADSLTTFFLTSLDVLLAQLRDNYRFGKSRLGNNLKHLEIEIFYFISHNTLNLILFELLIIEFSKVIIIISFTLNA